MGILKALGKFSDWLEDVYEVTCKRCGTRAVGKELSHAIQNLQEKSEGCGRNCHEPIIIK